MTNHLYTALLLALPDGGSGTAIPGTETPLNNAASYVVWGVLALSVFGFIFGCAKLGIAHHQRSSPEMGAIALPIVSAIGALSATAIVTGIVGT